MIAIKIGTTSWRTTNALAADEVQFTGVFIYGPDGATPHMVWDAGLGNVRAMTAPEIAALPGQKATAAAQQAKAAATGGIDNGQLVGGDKQERLIRALALVVLDEVNILRAASVPALAARTAAQLVSAIKAKIAATAE